MFDDWLWQSIPTTFKFLTYVFVMCVIVALVVSTSFYVYQLSKQRHTQGTDAEKPYSWLSLFIPALVLALIGGMSGQLGGGSRESVVGDLVPAIFALLGGYSAYLLGEKEVKRPLLVPNGLSFVFAFFLLYNMAAVWRQESEIQDFCLNLFSDPDFDNATLISYRHGTFAEHCKMLFE